MKVFRQGFQKNTITPKQHFLEKHCVPWIEEYSFGLGFHGEQGGELIHASVNKLQRRVLGIKNESELRVVMQSQHMLTIPELIDFQLTLKKGRNNYSNLQCMTMHICECPA